MRLETHSQWEIDPHSQDWFLSDSSLSKGLFHPVLCFASFVFFDNWDTKLQWSGVFGILYLVVGIVMIFALPTMGNISPPLGRVVVEDALLDNDIFWGLYSPCSLYAKYCPKEL